MQTQERFLHLDAVCGLLIIYMIMGHAFQWSHTTDDFFYIGCNRFLFFFMAWFFYKSGMFHKEKELKEIWRLDFQKLIFPYILYSIMGEFTLWYELFFIKGDYNIIHYTLSPLKEIVMFGSCIGNLPLWFLPALFFVKLSYGIIDRYKMPKWFLCAVGIFIAYMGNMANTDNDNNWIPYTLINTSLGIVFYYGGYQLRELQYDKRIITLAFVLYMATIVVLPSSVDFRTGVTTYGSWIIYLLSSFSGIIIINNLLKIKFLQIKFIKQIGKNSLSYFCFHWILFKLIDLSLGFANLHYNNYKELYALLVGSIFILPVYSYCIQFIKEKRLWIGRFI